MPKPITTITGIIGILLITAIAQASRPGEALIQRLCTRIKSRHGIEIVTTQIPGSPWTDIVYSAATPKDDLQLLRFLQILNQELDLYPDQFFQQQQLHHIVLLKKVFFSERPADGFYRAHKNAIFLNFLHKRSNVIAQRHTIHHEIFHMIEANQGTLSHQPDTTWQNYNSPDFQYGLNTIKSTSHNTTTSPFAMAREHPGFITPYAMLSAKEDKAEIFASLMVPIQNKLLHRWSQNDAILGKKTQHIKTLIHKLIPSMTF